jgi:hypothetical protein
LNDSTDESSGKNTYKDQYHVNENGETLKELITTERFLSEDDLKRNPYLFESDEFVR